jgi:hypothetical protein
LACAPHPCGDFGGGAEPCAGQAVSDDLEQQYATECSSLDRENLVQAFGDPHQLVNDVVIRRL